VTPAASEPVGERREVTVVFVDAMEHFLSACGALRQGIRGLRTVLRFSGLEEVEEGAAVHGFEQMVIEAGLP
jgi:hypothetical protein